MAFIINEDHWAFLEDIEAPMWVDLTLEANSNNHDYCSDDKWFYTSHQFHQCSASQLKSAFSHSGDGGSTLDFDLIGPSSPKLPASVSKSRGKHYKSKKWKGDKQDFSFDKPHPVKVLTGKSSLMKLGPRDKMKHKSSSIPKKTSISGSSIVTERSLSGNAVSNCSNNRSTCGDLGSSLSSDANKTVDTNPTSTVTSETESGYQKMLKAIDVSSQAFGHPSGLLSVTKISLRRSFIARRATRVEINNDGKHSTGRNSASSKSSVGSSSNPRHYVRNSTATSVRPKEITPDSRNVGRMIYVAKSKVNSPGIPPVKIEERTSNNRRGCQANTAKSTCQEAAKQKVLYRPSRTKALVPSRVNEQDSTVAATKAKKKPGIIATKSNILVGDGKENVAGKMPASQKKCNGRDVVAGGGVASQKGTKPSLSGRNDKAGNVRLKGKGRNQSNLERPRNSTQRVHFR